YDNALFLSVLSEVYRETQNPLFGLRIKETINWMMSEMTVTAGSFTAFASSFDADSADKEGNKAEGAYYVWHAAEIDAVLEKTESAFFKQAYDITQGGNWEGVCIPNRLRQTSLLS